MQSLHPRYSTNCFNCFEPNQSTVYVSLPFVHLISCRPAFCSLVSFTRGHLIIVLCPSALSSRSLLALSPVANFSPPVCHPPCSRWSGSASGHYSSTAGPPPWSRTERNSPRWWLQRLREKNQHTHWCKYTASICRFHSKMHWLILVKVTKWLTISHYNNELMERSY